MKLTTTRFDEITVDENGIIEMRGPILGFEQHRQYTLLHHNEKTPFMWFQSLEDGAVAFVVIDPHLVKEDYEPLIQDNDIARLEISAAEDVSLLIIVTIQSEPFLVTANLRAPIVINAKKRLAAQIVLDDAELSVQYDLAKKSV
jgi:flagellar assembly factor FliW